MPPSVTQKKAWERDGKKPFYVVPSIIPDTCRLYISSLLRKKDKMEIIEVNLLNDTDIKWQSQSVGHSHGLANFSVKSR